MTKQQNDLPANIDTSVIIVAILRRGDVRLHVAFVSRVKDVVDFHTRHKLLVLAHSEPHYRKLGRIVAEAKQSPIAAAYEQYSQLFMEGLARHATAKKHANVLEHMMGYFSKVLSKEERKELLELTNDFRQRLIPLVVPLTLFRHYVKKYRVTYLENQIYLQPSPKELMLRNHV